MWFLSGVCPTAAPASFAEWGGILVKELSLQEGKILATEFGSMSLPSGGYPNYGVMLSGP